MTQVPDFDAARLARLVRSSYDRAAARYTELFADELAGKPADRDLLDEFARAVRPGGLVGEVGCGPGHVGHYVRARGPSVCGIDLSPAMCAAARGLTGHPAYAAGDMLALPVRDGALSGLLAFYAVIHLLRADVPHAFREFARVLQPGAPLLCAVHAGDGDVYVEEVFDLPVPMYATFFARAELVQYVERAGFTVEQAVERDPQPGEVTTQRIYLLAHR